MNDETSLGQGTTRSQDTRKEDLSPELVHHSEASEVFQIRTRGDAMSGGDGRTDGAGKSGAGGRRRYRSWLKAITAATTRECRKTSGGERLTVNDTTTGASGRSADRSPRGGTHGN